MQRARGLARGRIEICRWINLRELGSALAAPCGGIGAVRGTLGPCADHRRRALRKTGREAWVKRACPAPALSRPAVWSPPHAHHPTRTKLARAWRNPQHANVYSALDMHIESAWRHITPWRTSRWRSSAQCVAHIARRLDCARRTVSVSVLMTHDMDRVQKTGSARKPHTACGPVAALMPLPHSPRRVDHGNAARSRSPAPRRPPAASIQTLKLLPHPQVVLAFGLRITNCAPVRLSV